MLAIPVDIDKLGTKSSLLFGNVSIFALYDPHAKAFTFKTNSGRGNGIETAKTLQSWGVKKAVYSFLGDGPFKTMINNGIDVYFLGKNPMSLDDVVKGLSQSAFIKVDLSNAQTYLDPGTTTGNCQCGCSHE